MINLVKIIYQVVISQDLAHAHQLKQVHVTLIQLQEMMLQKQQFAFDI